MSVDDILFAPIDLSGNKLDQKMIGAIKNALTGINAIEFFVDSTTAIETYEQIADLVENDPQVLRYTTQMVKPDNLGLRPVGALTIKDVFHRIHGGENEFFFCGRANGNGIIKERFTNWFSIDSQIPILHIVDPGNGPGVGGFFEWWLIGLMSQFCGYNQHYGFATEAAARNYYAIP